MCEGEEGVRASDLGPSENQVKDRLAHKSSCGERNTYATLKNREESAR